LKALAKEKWSTQEEPSGTGTTKLSLKLPSGERVVRRFGEEERMEVGCSETAESVLES